MARKEAKPPERSNRRTARVALAVGLGVAFLAAIAVLGSVAGARIGPRERYQRPIDAIDCQPPPWVDAATFWAEVRYLGDLPDRFTTTDPESVGRVRAAIAKHPWVEFVADDGYLTVGGRYPLTVGFRRPTLAVTVAGVSGFRSVDGKGILLPVHGPMETIARLIGERPPPRGIAGEPWGDPVVRRATELAVQFDAESIEPLAPSPRSASSSATIASRR
jgi:hypothetical protein